VKLSNSDSTTTTNVSADSFSVGLTLGVDFNIGFAGLSLKDTQSWTWDNQSSVSHSQTETQNATATIYGPSAAFTGPTAVLVYWDSVYRTFAFVFNGQQPKSGQTVSGLLLGSAGAPIAYGEVALEDANGRHYAAITDSRGSFTFYGIPAGAAQLAYHNAPRQIMVDEVANYHVIQQ
jgi:hypothetical protein